MINKEYLDHLKKTDPMSYYDITQDPMVVGEDSNDGCLMTLGCFTIFVFVMIIIAFIIW